MRIERLCFLLAAFCVYASAEESPVEAVFSRYCASCHTGEDAPSSLRLDSAEAAESASAVSAEILRRMTLPAGDPKAMPPASVKRRPTAADIETVRAWAASLSKTAADNLTPKEAKQLPPSPETPADAAAVLALKEAGAYVSRVSQETHWLTVDVSDRQLPLESFRQIAPWVYELDLSGAEAAESVGAALTESVNLRRLNLSRAPHVDPLWLAQLTTLETLNLYGAQCGDEVLDALGTFPNLDRVYLSDTRVTEEGVNRLRQMRPDMAILDASLKRPPHAVAWSAEQIQVWRRALQIWGTRRTRKFEDARAWFHPRWSGVLPGQVGFISFDDWKTTLTEETRGRTYPVLQLFPRAVQIADNTAAVYADYYFSSFKGTDPVETSSGRLVEVYIKTEAGWVALSSAQMEASE